MPDKTLSKEHKLYNYSRELWDGKTAFSYARDNRNQRNRLGTLIIDKNYKPSEMELLPRGMMFGRFAGDDKRIDKVLRQADVISLRGQMEEVSGSECYVIDAIVKNGKYTVWLDPQHGYNVAKAEVRKEKGSRAYGRQLESGFRIDSSFEVVSFEKVDDVWLPMEAFDKGVSEWPGGHFSKGTTHIARNSVMLNPDHDALGSFLPDDILDGAEVHIVQIPHITYTWLNGKIVDSYGNEVDIRTLKPPSLMGKALPNLRQFNLRLNPKLVENKMVLVCFWDMNQRPSRNCVQNLNKRAQTLLNRNVYMIFVHAGPVAEKKLIAWLKNNKIEHPVGMSRANLPELGQSWGVQSLPWLILTDKKHIVQAEGFGINELDEKITRLRKK